MSIINHKSIKMKKLFVLKILFLILTGCNGTNNVMSEISSRGGEILSGENKGGDYKFGSMEMANLSISFSNAFTNQDYSFVTEENFTKTMYFYPEKGLDRIELELAQGIEIMKGMHEPYDSITRSIYDVVPIVPSYDETLTIVMFPFTEKRYRKDGEVETYRFLERHYIKNGKITGLRKYSQEE